MRFVFIVNPVAGQGNLTNELQDGFLRAAEKANIQAYLAQKGEWHPKEENSFCPALCNRIDRNTGGIVIACGMAKYEGSLSVAPVFDRADQNMYRNKSDLKDGIIV